MTWNDRDNFEQSRADHQMEVEMAVPLDATHAAAVEERILVRREFAAARRRVAAWEPEPYPGALLVDEADRNRILLYDAGAIYADELPRPWFRS